MFGGLIRVVKAFRPPQSSIDNYNLVWEYAECTKEEAKHERQKILDNFDELDLSYKLMADRIRGIK
jgi:hypothetical protein